MVNTAVKQSLLSPLSRTKVIARITKPVREDAPKSLGQMPFQPRPLDKKLGRKPSMPDIGPRRSDRR